MSWILFSGSPPYIQGWVGGRERMRVRWREKRKMYRRGIVGGDFA
jgi:hypothetical protein